MNDFIISFDLTMPIAYSSHNCTENLSQLQPIQIAFFRHMNQFWLWAYFLPPRHTICLFLKLPNCVELLYCRCFVICLFFTSVINSVAKAYSIVVVNLLRWVSPMISYTHMHSTLIHIFLCDLIGKPFSIRRVNRRYKIEW